MNRLSIFTTKTKEKSLSITLYELKSQNIDICMRVFFNDENKLVFEGYDIGKSVNKAMGDSDYEYFHYVAFDEARKIARLFEVDINEKMVFLKEIKKRFDNNYAYSNFGAFMKENNIVFESFKY